MSAIGGAGKDNLVNIENDLADGLEFDPTGPITSLATASNQINGSQKTQVVTNLGTVGGFDNSGDIHLLVHDDIVDSTLSGIASNLSDVATETTLDAINTKTPALGQALAASSVPVILPAATITTLTPPAAITGFATSAKQDDLSTKIGTVDASPGIYTVLGRLAAGMKVLDPTGTAQYPATENTLSDVVLATEGIYTNTLDLAAIKTAVQLLDNAVDGNYINTNLNIAGTDVAAGAGVLNAQTQRVTIATDDEVNNLLGTIDADTSTLAGAVSGSEMQVDVVTMPAVTISNGSINGAGAPTIDSYTRVAINLAAGANQSLVSAPGANKQIWVYGIGFTVNVAGTVSFQDEDDTAITGIMQIGATGGMTVAPSGNFAMPLWKVATNKALEVDVVTSELDGWLTYAIVSV